MIKSEFTALGALRFKPLAACVALAIAATSSLALADASTERATLLAVPALQTAAPTSTVAAYDGWLAHRPGKRALANMPVDLTIAPQPASTKPVISCLDDGSTGTLRSIMATAVTGDVIDLSALTCSTITLQTGAIITPATITSLTVIGPAAGNMTIDGSGSSNGIFQAYGTGTLTLQNLTLANSVYSGAYPDGGAIFTFGSVSLSNVTMTNNSAYGYNAQGGAIAAPQGSVTVSNSTFTNNLVHSTGGTYQPLGGAVVAGHGMVISNSSFTGNSVISDSGASTYGGALAVAGTNTISNSTFSGNGASGGSAVFIFASATAAFTNATVSGNTATTKSGAILSTGTLRLSNSTVAFNQSTIGPGGVYIKAGTELESTIVSNNTSAASGVDGNIGGTSGSVLSGANNVIPTSGITPPAGTITVDPNLQPLADNGGSVDAQPHPKTHALVAGSSAVNAGNNTANVSTDERGHKRVFGTLADVGAFELDDTIFRDSF